MDRFRIEVVVQLYVAQTMAAQALKMAYLALNATEAEVKAAHDQLRQQARATTLPGVDPSLSDHVSDEIAVALDRAIADVETHLRSLWQPRSG